MYKRYYKLKCLDGPKMKRFRIVTTQGLPFEQLMKNYSVKMPGFISAIDDHFDDEKWEITTTWETKSHFDEAQKHPMRKMFWNRFEIEALRHDIQMIVIDGDTGESYEPLSLD
jgi:hypothetical protein